MNSVQFYVVYLIVLEMSNFNKGKKKKKKSRMIIHLQNTDYQIIYLKFCKLTIFDVIACHRLSKC